MSYEFTIGTPVLAAHINSLFQRLAAVAQNCPSVSALTTVNVAGYAYAGNKGALPGVGGFLPVTSPVHGAASVLQVIAPAFLDALPAETESQRDYSVISCDIRVQPIVGSGVTPYSIAPTYSASIYEAENSGPIAYALSSATTTAPSSTYIGNGVYLGTKETGTTEYEQDEMPLTAWITTIGIDANEE